MRRTLIILLTPISFLLLATLLWLSWLNPSIENWAKNKIISASRDNSPLALEIDKVSIDLLSPRLQIRELVVTPQTADLAQLIEKLRIKNIETKIDAYKLLTGTADISGILADSIDLEINIDPLLNSTTPPKEIPTEQIFNTLQKLPLSKIKLSTLRLVLHSKKLGLLLVSDKIDLDIEKKKEQLLVEVSSDKLNVTESNIGSSDFSIHITAGINKDNIRIQDSTIQRDGLSIKTFGLIPKWSSLPVDPTFEFQPQTKVDLEILAQAIPALKKLKSLKGTLESSSKIEFKKGQLKALSEIRTQKFEIEGFEIGDAKIFAETSNDLLKLKNVNVSHPAGSLNISDFQLRLHAPFEYKGQIQTPHLDLHKLLLNIGVGEVPVWIPLEGKVLCRGDFKNLNNTCSAQLNAKEIIVKTSMTEKQSLVHLENIKVSGDVTIDTKEVSYKAALQLGKAQGKSAGVINYDRGFNINYETPSLDFANVKNLANLKMAGNVQLKGSTEGDSSAATFEIVATGKNFVLENYKLGNLKTFLNYKKGVLYFEKTSGAFNKTSYVGELEVDLNQSSINGQFVLPTAELEDVVNILDHLYLPPFTIQGSGDGFVEISGPLDFWKMNHNLQAQFKGVNVAGERFDSLRFISKGTDGRIDLRGSELVKNKNKITVSQGVLPYKKLDLAVNINQFPLEQSDIIGSVTNSVFGNLSANLNLSGSIDSPSVKASASITDTVVDEQELSNSKIDFFADNQSLRTQFQLIGNKIKGSIQAPVGLQNRTPLKINLKMDNWNFVNALSALTEATNLQDIDSLLTADIDLQSNTGDIFKSTGSIYIPNLYIRRGNQYLSHSTPLEVQFSEGVANIKNFNLEGPGNVIKIQGENATAEKLNFRIKAEADLRFAHILAPFLEDLGGPISVNTTISGSLRQPQIFGFADILNGFVRIKGFPHPFERIQANVAFSQAKISINNLKASVASGTLNGGGNIQILGIRNTPVSINARLDNVKLNVPEKVRTSGSADMSFTGSWFPFVLAGTYKVDGALVNKEFTEGSTVSNIRQSIYLPKVLKQSNFDPVLLDIQVVLDKNIIIKNSLANGSATGSLTVKGPPSNPGLIGKVEFNKNSQLTFKDKIFDIITGTATFKSADDINPELFISAQSRIGEYDVTLLVQGEAKDPTFALNSIPPLSENDLISLLALGVTSSNLEQNVQSKDQQVQTGYEIGAAIFSNNPLNKKLSETIGWNLKFTTNFDSTRNIAVPKIVAEKKLTDRLNATAGRTLDQGMVDLKLQYLINNNWSAIGTWEEKQAQESADASSTTTKTNTPSIFGLDLEFKKEFK